MHHVAARLLVASPRPDRPAPLPPRSSRYDAIGAELKEPSYFGLDLPWSISTAAVLNSLLMGGVELFRCARRWAGPFAGMGIAWDGMQGVA